MKKTLIIIFCFLSFWVKKADAQITLDTIISPLGIGFDFYTVQISEDETKYYFADTNTNTFSLYNMDFTPFIENIAVPEPFANFGYFALYISRTLFDCDSTNIEYLYQATGFNDKPVRIVRTDGTILFELDSAVAPYCNGLCLGWSDIIVPIRNTSNGTKLFLNKYDPNGRQKIHIYSLCGELPTKTYDLPISKDYIVKIYPNPTSKYLNFQINLPDNRHRYELFIFDSNSKEIKREYIDNTKINYSIDVSDFSPGTYFYSIRNEYGSYKSGKFILKN